MDEFKEFYTTRPLLFDVMVTVVPMSILIGITLLIIFICYFKNIGLFNYDTDSKKFWYPTRAELNTETRLESIKPTKLSDAQLKSINQNLDNSNTAISGYFTGPGLVNANGK